MGFDDLNIPKITKDELLESIAQGVRMAVFDVATNATSMPSSDFYEAIRQGTQDAMTGLEK